MKLNYVRVICSWRKRRRKFNITWWPQIILCFQIYGIVLAAFCAKSKDYANIFVNLKMKFFVGAELHQLLFRDIFEPPCSSPHFKDSEKLIMRELKFDLLQCVLTCSVLSSVGVSLQFLWFLSLVLIAPSSLVPFTSVDIVNLNTRVVFCLQPCAERSDPVEDGSCWRCQVCNFTS